ncbi:MAG: hypothetical protein HYY34_07695 [Chloroflexi bacterium]|nr:hypothetical protein [Chloroflexota bacterium]
MIRIGGYAVPDLSLADAAAAVQKAHRAYGPSFSRESFAGVTGLNSRGGWFAAVIASLRLWGLAEGRGTIRLTSGGMRLARAKPGEELDAAMIEAARAMPLLKEITGRSPDSAPRRTDLALMLAEITGADAGRIHSALPQVQRLLADAFPANGGRGGLRPSPPTLPAPTQSAGIELSFSGGRLSLPETPGNLELAADLLRRRAAEMQGPVSG